VKTSFAQAWQDYKLLLGVALLYALVASGQVLMLRVHPGNLMWWVLTSVADTCVMALAFLTVAAVPVLLIHLFKMRPHQRGWGHAFQNALIGFRDQVLRYLQGPMFANGCFGLLIAIASFFFIFQKATVRFIHPYWSDPLFTRIDLAIHGDYPYLLVRELSHSSQFAELLQVCYFGWFFVMYAVIGCCLFFDPDRQRRMTVIWVFALCWFYLGGLGATLLSCGGPIFFHDTNPGIPDPYVPLQTALDAQADDIRGIILVRGLMIGWLKSVSIVVPNAPAAMPSLHSAIALLVFIYLRSIDNILGILAFGFFILIGLACVYFGFHYAVDVYFSMIAVPLMWWAVGRHVRYRAKMPYSPEDTALSEARPA